MDHRRQSNSMVTGLLIGLVFGATYPIPWAFDLVPGFPLLLGSWAIGLGLGGSRDPDGGVLISLLFGNAVSYGLCGTLIGAAIGRWRRERALRTPVVPECPLCGLRWPVPDSPRCPQCHHADAFASWMSERALMHRCATCGYDLQGTVSGRCPECGEAF